MKKIIPFVVLILLMTNNAFADEPCVKGGTITVPVTPDPEDQKLDLPTPCPGEHLNVIVQVPVKKESDHKVTYTPTYITYPEKESRYRFRGGVSIGAMFPGRSDASLTGGVTGEIHTKSVAVQGTFRAGNCNEGLALNGGLAVMGKANKHLRAGIGADLLYCSDVNSAPKEVAKERVVGGSLRLQLVLGHFVADASVGMGAITYQTPGSRQTDPAVYGGFSLGYLWGK